MIINFYMLRAFGHLIINGLIFALRTFYYGYNMYFNLSQDIVWIIGLLIIIFIDATIIVIHLTIVRDAFLWQFNMFLCGYSDMSDTIYHNLKSP